MEILTLLILGVQIGNRRSVMAFQALDFQVPPSLTFSIMMFNTVYSQDPRYSESSPLRAPGGPQVPCTLLAVGFSQWRDLERSLGPERESEGAGVLGALLTWPMGLRISMATAPSRGSLSPRALESLTPLDLAASPAHTSRRALPFYLLRIPVGVLSCPAGSLVRAQGQACPSQGLGSLPFIHQCGQMSRMGFWACNVSILHCTSLALKAG